jgi:hypothetical protein
MAPGVTDESRAVVDPEAITPVTSLLNMLASTIIVLGPSTTVVAIWLISPLPAMRGARPRATDSHLGRRSNRGDVRRPWVHVPDSARTNCRDCLYGHVPLVVTRVQASSI